MFVYYQVSHASVMYINIQYVKKGLRNTRRTRNMESVEDFSWICEEKFILVIKNICVYG